MADNLSREFQGRQFERVFAELAEIRAEQTSVRDDLRVLTTIVLRHDATLNGILEQLHALTSQHNRFDLRLRRLEEERGH